MRVSFVFSAMALSVFSYIMASKWQQAVHDEVFNSRKAIVDILADDVKKDIELWSDYDETKDQYLESIRWEAEKISAIEGTVVIVSTSDPGVVQDYSHYCRELELPDRTLYMVMTVDSSEVMELSWPIKAVFLVLLCWICIGPVIDSWKDRKKMELLESGYYELNLKDKLK